MTDEDQYVLSIVRKRLLRSYLFIGTNLRTMRDGTQYISLRGKLDVKGRWKHITDLPLPLEMTDLRLL